LDQFVAHGSLCTNKSNNNNEGFSGILKGGLQANRERHFGAHFPIRFSRTNFLKNEQCQMLRERRFYPSSELCSTAAHFLISHQVANFAMFAAIRRASSAHAVVPGTSFSAWSQLPMMWARCSQTVGLLAQAPSPIPTENRNRPKS
jgi:hypothetical protein